MMIREMSLAGLALAVLALIALGLLVLSGVVDTADIALPHAVQRHGNDALMARLAVGACDPRMIQVYMNPLSRVLLLCPEMTGTRWAGMIVAVDGTEMFEVTAFVAAYSYWQRVVVRDSYEPAPAAVVRLVMGGLAR